MSKKPVRYVVQLKNSLGLSGVTVQSASIMLEGTARAGGWVSATIIPATGSMTIDPKPIQVNVSDTIAITDSADSPEANQESSPIPTHPSVDWVEYLSWWFPKQVRELIFGDVCEIRARMAAKGCSQAQIDQATLSQLSWSILEVLWSRFGWIAVIYSRVIEWLNK